MRLVNLQSNKPIVEFRGDEVVFHNKFLEKEMRLLGIPIPNGLRGDFEGQDTVYLESKNFQRAFKEIYYPVAMGSHLFRWTD